MLSTGLLFARVTGALKAVPWQVWAGLAIIAAVLIYGSHREAQGYAEAKDYYEAKISAADKARADALASEEQALRALAKETDNNVAKERVANRDRTERFIANGGVRQACPRGGGAEGGSAGRSQGMHQAPELDGTESLPEVVTVLPDDVRICTDNTLTAEALQAYILGLERPER